MEKTVDISGFGSYRILKSRNLLGILNEAF